MKFCSQCSAPVALRIPDGDALPRHVCTACGTIHYQNPKMVVGCIPEWEDKVLLCRRAIEPRRGMWTVPAGFMENGETTFQGAIRETLEEANARVEVDSLYALYNIPYISQVYDAFGAQRMFWGSDLSRLPCSYRQGVTYFTEALSWLKGRDLELVMGRALCEWIGWEALL